MAVFVFHVVMYAEHVAGVDEFGVSAGGGDPCEYVGQVAAVYPVADVAVGDFCLGMFCKPSAGLGAGHEFSSGLAVSLLDEVVDNIGAAALVALCVWVAVLGFDFSAALVMLAVVVLN